MDLHELFEFPNPLIEIGRGNGKAITDKLLEVLEMDNKPTDIVIYELFPILGYTFVLLEEQIFMHTFFSGRDSAYIFIADLNENKYYITSSTLEGKIININSSSKRISNTFITRESNLLNNLYKALSLMN